MCLKSACTIVWYFLLIAKSAPAYALTARSSCLCLLREEQLSDTCHKRSEQTLKAATTAMWPLFCQKGNQRTNKQTNKQIQSTNANDDPHASFSSHPFLHKSVFFIESMCDYLAGVSWWTVPGHSALLKSVSSYTGHQMNNRQHVIQHPVLFGHAICTRKSTRLLVGEPTVSAHTQKLGNKHLARWLLEKSSNDIRDKAQNDREKQFHLVSLVILLHPLRLDKIITFR